MLRRSFLASGAVALLAGGVAGNASAAPAGAGRSVTIATTRIAGTRRSSLGRRAPEFAAEGASLALRRVPDDRFDPRAIVVLDEQGRSLGRLPGVDCRILARMLDAGLPLEGRVASAATGSAGALVIDIVMPISGDGTAV